MKKLVLVTLCFTSIYAEIVLTQEVIYDGMLNGIKSVAKELTGQNNEIHEKNCKIEYKKLFERNSYQLEKEKEKNAKFKTILKMNNIVYKEVQIKHLPVRKGESCSIVYWDYFKSSSHDISELSKENKKIKTILTNHHINYEPLLKTNIMGFSSKKGSNSDNERTKAKEELKKQMAM